MTSIPTTPETPAEVKTILERLKRRIRMYVWLDGLSLALLWLGLTFWVAMALDYLPVAMGLSDLPWQARVVILAIITVVFGLIVYHWILKRILVRLSDTSMALLLERQYSEFSDALLTSVQLGERSVDEGAENFDPAMLERTSALAAEHLPQVNLSSVFRTRPLLLKWIGAGCVMGSVLVFAILAGSSFLLGAERIYLLGNDPWPRACYVEVVGVQIVREHSHAMIPDDADQPKFVDGVLKVGRGSTLILDVRAEAPTEDRPERAIPRSCLIRYATAEGDRGSRRMQSSGAVSNGYQPFRYDEEPFKGLLSDLKFTVQGGDFRTPTQVIEVVDLPAVIATEIDCQFPSYLIDEESGSWTARTLNWPSGVELPVGTSAVLRCRTSKPLDRVYARHVEMDESFVIDSVTNDGEFGQFELSLPSIEETATYEFILHDLDGVITDTIHTVHLPAVEDQAPAVKSRLVGIGTAITPQAKVTLKGTIFDDYVVDEAWAEVRGAVSDPFDADVALNSAGEMTVTIDFRELSRRQPDALTLDPGEDQAIDLVIRASDKYDLDGGEHIGSGERVELAIVTPSQLLRILERLEVGQRRRLVQIHEEMRVARDQLYRTQLDLAVPEDEGDSDTGELAEDANVSTSSDDDDPVSDAELKLLFARRALLQSEKSAREIEGVADSFEDIRAQLTNNRVESEQRLKRIQYEVIEPLRQIHSESFAKLIEDTQQLESQLEALQTQSADAQLALEVNLASDQAIVDVERVLNEIDLVLAKLVKYEDYSELLELVRQVIRDQEELLKQTKNEHNKQGLRDLLDQ